MPSFQYTAISSTGERIVGVLTGGNEQAVLAELESRRLTPVAVAPARERARRAGRNVPPRQLAASYLQLADLLRAGVPLLRSIKLLGSRKSAPALAKVFSELAAAVADGSELAAAMEAKPEIFPRVHIAMVRAGEKGGFLEAVLARLGQFLTAQAELRSKIVGNLIYPCILILAGIVILGIIFGYFIPMFRPMFAKMELGVLTRSVLGLSDLISAYGLYLLVPAVIGIVSVWRLCKRPSMQGRLDRIKMRTPVLGPILRTIGVARFCRILGTLLSNAIPMLGAMQIAKDAAGNTIMEQAIDKAADAVRHGQALAPPLAESGLFADDVVEMISVGESANNLDDVLVSIADTLEQRLDRQLAAAVKLIEPALLIMLAIIVGLVAISLILPMTQLSAGVGG